MTQTEPDSISRREIGKRMRNRVQPDALARGADAIQRQILAKKARDVNELAEMDAGVRPMESAKPEAVLQLIIDLSKTQISNPEDRRNFLHFIIQEIDRLQIQVDPLFRRDIALQAAEITEAKITEYQAKLPLPLDSKQLEDRRKAFSQIASTFEKERQENAQQFQADLNDFINSLSPDSPIKPKPAKTS